MSSDCAVTAHTVVSDVCSLPVVKLTTRDLAAIAAVREALLNGDFQRRREESHLSRAEVATLVDASFDAVALWEAGRRIPRTEAALRLGRLYRRLQHEAAAV